MKSLLLIPFLLIAFTSKSQTVIKTIGKTFTNSDTTWLGVNIPRTKPTKLIFKNNTITSRNTLGYMLQAGEEGTDPEKNNNLDGAIITGNKFNWSGTDMKCITHGLFTGHNSDVVVKYNYLDNVPMGIIHKSTNNMKNKSGGVAYNIVKGGVVGFVIKGMSNVNVYNNTFYNDRTTAQTWRPLIHIYTNTDRGGYSVAHNNRIFNNIFYTKYETFSITLDDTESLKGFECDYNVYWCETGSPKFKVNGQVKTFAEWQAMGYDAHSVVKNPDFKDFINFVPRNKLEYGTDLGEEWKLGLSPAAKWGKKDPKTAVQKGKWQVGAIIN